MTVEDVDSPSDPSRIDLPDGADVRAVRWEDETHVLLTLFGDRGHHPEPAALRRHRGRVELRVRRTPAGLTSARDVRRSGCSGDRDV